MYKHLKDLRESLGMTQEEFGNSVGVAKSTYNNYETGIRNPKSDFWIAVAQKYNVTIDYLMGHSDDPHSIGPDVKQSPGTNESVPRDGREYEIMGLVYGLDDSQKDFLISLLEVVASKNQQKHLSVQVSEAESTPISGDHDQT